MMDIFGYVSIDRREEIVLGVIAALVPLATLPAMLGV